MADRIITNVIPNMKAVDLGDGTFGYAVVSEQAQDRGIATGGSNTTCADTTKNWIVNHYAGDTIEVVVGGVEYFGLIASNTATVITMGALGGGAIVVAGDPYKIKSAAGAEATIADGADVTQGAIADAAVVAGAVGTLSAKLRAISRDMGAAVVDLAAIEIINTAINTAFQAGGITQLQLAAMVTDLAAIELINADIETAVQAIEAATEKTVVTTPTTGTGTAIATLAPGVAFHFSGFHLHIGSALAAAETLTVTLDALAGVAYDTPLYTLDMGTPDIRNISVEFEGKIYDLVAGDQIVIALSANAGGDTFGCQTKHYLL